MIGNSFKRPARALAGAVVALALCAVAHGRAQDQPPAPNPPPAPAAAPTPGARMPVEAFAEVPFVDSPSLSPDGTRVAALVRLHGSQRLMIVNIADSSKNVAITLSKIGLNNWHWVNNDWLIATIGDSQNVEGTDFYVTRTVAISADGKTTRVLGGDKIGGQNASDVIWIAHDGSPHILLGLQNSIYIDNEDFWPVVRDFDVSTGRGRDVVRPHTNVFDWYADSAGTVRLGIYRDDAVRVSRMLYRGTANDPFRSVDEARGRGGSLGNIPLLFLPDPHHAITIGDDDNGFSTVYDFDLASLARGAALFNVPGYDVGGVIGDRDGTKLLGVYYTDTRPHTHWFDEKLGAIQAQLDDAVGPTRRAQILSWDSDFSTLLILVDAPNRPGDYYIYPVADGVMHFLSHHYSTLANRAFAPVTTIHYKARDGLDIAAILTLPEGKAAKDLPLIMMPHGGPAARDDESWDYWAQFLANRGYAVLQPNYRGSTGYGTAFYDKGRGQWGLGMQDDLVDAVKWATTQGIADAKRVCIVGGSYGGYAALRAAQRDQGVYRCAVSFAGVSDMPGMLHYDGQFLNGNGNKDYLRDRAPDLKAVSPINFPEQFSIPVLLIHGKEDRRVPVGQSRQMAAKLKAAGKTVTYIEQPEGDHFLSRGEDRLQFLKELEAFLTQYNPA